MLVRLRWAVMGEGWEGREREGGGGMALSREDEWVNAGADLRHIMAAELLLIKTDIAYISVYELS